MADRTPALVDQYGNPVKIEVLTKDVAGPTLTGVRSPMTGYPGDGLNPRRLAHLLRDADQGEPLRYLELAEQIEERDLHYAGVLGTRKRSVAQIDIVVDAASDDALAVEQADMVRDWLKRDELQDELFDVLDAVGKGWSATEILWDSSEGQWWPARLEWRDPRWFRFSRKDGVTPLLRLDLLAEGITPWWTDGIGSNSAEAGAVPLPPWKFITARIKAKSGLPIRSGIARLACWAWMFKAYTQRDWAIFTQTFGQPVRVGKYHAGATEEDKETLFRAVANIAGDCAAIIPESMSIDFVESKNVGQGTDLYLKRSEWLDQQVSKAVLGQTATTDAIAGGHAVGKEHRKVQEDIERADAKALSAVLNRDLVRPWVMLNYGPQKLYPRLRIERPEQEDLDRLSAILFRLVPMGLKVQASEVRDRLGFADPEEGAALLTPAPASSPPVTLALPALQSQTRRLPTQEEIARLAGIAAQDSVRALLDRVRIVVEGASSLAEVKAGIAKLDLPSAELASAMRQALVLARLLGRAEIAGAGDAD